MNINKFVMKDILTKNIVNPKFRPVGWLIVAACAILPSLSHPKIQTLIHGEGNFTFYDNKGSVICVMNHWFVSTTWECTNHSGIDLVENVSTEAKFWEYNSEDGKVIVERNNKHSGITYKVTHPLLDEPMEATVN